MKILSILVSALVLVLPSSSMAVEPLVHEKQESIRHTTKVRVAAISDKQSKAKPPTKRKSSKKKNTDAGLRSDGELVQAKKPKKLIGHELSHTMQQQGRVLTSSDLNSAAQSTSKRPKTHSPSPVPSPYPSIANQQNKNKNGVKDSNDRLSNMEVGHQAHSIPLQNATVSQIRTEQINSHHRTIKPVQIRVRLGAKCNSRDFPTNAVIERLGRLQRVECSKGNVALKRQE